MECHLLTGGRDVYVWRRLYSGDGVSAAYRNDIRQLHVNHVADRVGAGLGTGRFYGVPGTGLDFGYAPYYDRYDGRKYQYPDAASYPAGFAYLDDYYRH